MRRFKQPESEAVQGKPSVGGRAGTSRPEKAMAHGLGRRDNVQGDITVHLLQGGSWLLPGEQGAKETGSHGQVTHLLQNRESRPSVLQVEGLGLTLLRDLQTLSRVWSCRVGI